ncbi:MAG: hypothetical protein ABSF84_07455 [Acidimicrobiales bacterium]|jgi:uncharacterized membrane protein
MYGYGPHAHHPFLGILFLLLLAGLIVLVVVGVTRLTRGRPAHGGPPAGPSIDPALVELRLRYARGEITSDDYRMRAGNLGYQVPPGPTPPGGSPTVGPPPPGA